MSAGSLYKYVIERHNKGIQLYYFAYNCSTETMFITAYIIANRYASSQHKENIKCD